MKSLVLRSLKAGMFSCAVLLTTYAEAQSSPAMKDSVVSGGKTVSVKYASPSVRGRDIFGPGGLLSKETNYPIWRAGANAATAFHTDMDLSVGNLQIPKGDYTLFVNPVNADSWELVINKQTGQGGLTYDPSKDLGRIKMTMRNPATVAEQLTYRLTLPEPRQVKLVLAWEKRSGEVVFSVK